VLAFLRAIKSQLSETTLEFPELANVGLVMKSWPAEEEILEGEEETLEDWVVILEVVETLLDLEVDLLLMEALVAVEVDLLQVIYHSTLRYRFAICIRTKKI
jgi:hypothetical protein